MLPALAMTLLLAAPDRPVAVDLVPHAAPAAEVWVVEEHPVIVTLAISAAVVTAVAVIVALVWQPNRATGLQFPTTVSCAGAGCR